MTDVLVPLAIHPALPPRGSVTHQLDGRSMGTSWRVLVAAPAVPDDLAARLQRELDEIVAQMSHWEPDSVLTRFNAAPGGSWHALPPAFFHVLSHALALAQDSGGAYDAGAGALVNAWGFGAHGRYNQPGFAPPAAARIDALLARPPLQVDRATRRVLQPGGVELDLSSIAKGYAVDRMAQLLQGLGLPHHLVELGGELRGAGMKPDGQPWWVVIESVPDGAAGGAARVALHGLALATSGDYRRYFQYGERRVAHTIDPRSGRPLENGVAAVTVLHAECMAADALSTALTVLGPEAGLAFAEQRQLAARFLLRDGAAVRAVTTSAWRAMLDD